MQSRTFKTLETSPNIVETDWNSVNIYMKICNVHSKMIHIIYESDAEISVSTLKW